MRKVSFISEIFRTPSDVRRGELALKIYLSTLFRLDLLFLADFKEKTGEPYPPLYSAGVVYKVETPGLENWKTIPVVARDRQGDCEDLACWRAAELTAAGVPAEPIFIRQKTSRPGLRLFHIIVRLSDGRTDDPSKILGMK